MRMQITYDASEDRLLFCLDTGDRIVCFWLTRRLVALLWPVLWQRAGSTLDAAVANAAKPWLLRVKQDTANQAHAVTQEPRLQSTLPPLLVTTLQYGPGENGGHSLSLMDISGKGERLNLDDDGLYGFIRMLDEALGGTEWQLDLWQPGTDTNTAATPSRAMH